MTLVEIVIAVAAVYGIAIMVQNGALMSLFKTIKGRGISTPSPKRQEYDGDNSNGSLGILGDPIIVAFEGGDKPIYRALYPIDHYIEVEGIKGTFAEVRIEGWRYSILKKLGYLSYTRILRKIGDKKVHRIKDVQPTMPSVTPADKPQPADGALLPIEGELYTTKAAIKANFKRQIGDKVKTPLTDADVQEVVSLLGDNVLRAAIRGSSGQAANAYPMTKLRALGVTPKEKTELWECIDGCLVKNSL